MKKSYTVGEIVRLGLLKMRNGEPYTDKAAVLRRVRRMKHDRVKTQWGMGYAVSKKEIDRFNDFFGQSSSSSSSGSSSTSSS